MLEPQLQRELEELEELDSLMVAPTLIDSSMEQWKHLASAATLAFVVLAQLQLDRILD